MKFFHILALSAGLAGAALFADPTKAATTNQTASLSELGADAQSYYSEAEVGSARRAFRAQCSLKQDAGVCDCLAAAYAQALTPPELKLAAAIVAGRQGQGAARSFSTPEAEAAARTHIEAAAARYEPVCRQPAPA